MITIKIEKKRFKGVYSWSDLTLRKYIELASIPIPDGYRDFIQADGVFTPDNIQAYVDAVTKISDEQLNKEFPAYYRRVILCLTNIPERILDKVSNEQVTEKYEYFFKPFVVSLFYHKPVIHFMGQLTDYSPEPIEKNRVRVGSSYYCLPETVKIEGQDIALYKEPVISYIEACDIFKSMKVSREDVDKLALFMAIYLRRKGEKYDEEMTIKRKELMLSLPMSVVWSVFFYTVRRLPFYTHCIRLFGSLQRTTAQSVLEARTYRSMAVEA